MQKEFFQDDVFPDTAVTWEPVLSAKAWLGGANGQLQLLSLQPPGMTPGGIWGWVWEGNRGVWAGLEEGADSNSFSLLVDQDFWLLMMKDHVSRPSLSLWRAGPVVWVSIQDPTPNTHTQHTCYYPGQAS